MDSITLNGKLEECYYSLANIELAMNYYSLYEAWMKSKEETGLGGESGLLETAGIDKLRRDIGRLINRISIPEDNARNIKEAFELRTVIKRYMETVSAFIDRFTLYEYILNRLEPGYLGEIETFDDDEMARELLSKVFSSNDNMLINENIKMLVAQLPVRMTKGRFFDIIGNTFKQYDGFSISSYEKLVYMIESAAGIKEADNPDQCFDGIFMSDNMMNGLDYERLSREEYERAQTELKSSIRTLVNCMDSINSMGEIVNLICVILMNMSGVSQTAGEEVKKYKVILMAAEEGFSCNENKEMSEEVLGVFRLIEGRLEYYIEKLQRLEAGLDRAVESGASEILRDRLISQMLMSGSTFVDLEEKEDGTVDSDYIQAETDKLKEKLTAVFSSDGRMMKRARMAAVLKELPVFFNSRTEVMNYVRESLNGCRDNGEKLAAVKLVTEML